MQTYQVQPYSKTTQVRRAKLVRTGSKSDALRALISKLETHTKQLQYVCHRPFQIRETSNETPRLCRTKCTCLPVFKLPAKGGDDVFWV